MCYKRGIYESTIADILIKKDINLHYFKNSNSTQEIEFLIDDEALLKALAENKFMFIL